MRRREAPGGEGDLGARQLEEARKKEDAERNAWIRKPPDARPASGGQSFRDGGGGGGDDDRSRREGEEQRRREERLADQWGEGKGGQELERGTELAKK